MSEDQPPSVKGSTDLDAGCLKGTVKISLPSTRPGKWARVFDARLYNSPAFWAPSMQATRKQVKKKKLDGLRMKI